MDEKKRIITAEEVSNYVVCPEAWRLKDLGKGQKQYSERKEKGLQLRKEWTEKQILSSKFRSYAKIIYFMLLLVAITVFLLEHKRMYLRALRRELAADSAPDDKDSDKEGAASGKHSEEDNN